MDHAVVIVFMRVCVVVEVVCSMRRHSKHMFSIRALLSEELCSTSFTYRSSAQHVNVCISDCMIMLSILLEHYSVSRAYDMLSNRSLRRHRKRKNASQDGPTWLPRDSKTTPGGTKSNQNGIKISKNRSKSDLFSKKVLNVNWSIAICTI